MNALKPEGVIDAIDVTIAGCECTWDVMNTPNIPFAFTFLSTVYACTIFTIINCSHGFELLSLQITTVLHQPNKVILLFLQSHIFQISCNFSLKLFCLFYSLMRENFKCDVQLVTSQVSNFQLKLHEIQKINYKTVKVR